MSGLPGWCKYEEKGKKDGGKRRREGGKNMFSLLLAGIKGCIFELACIYPRSERWSRGTIGRVCDSRNEMTAPRQRMIRS